MPFGDGTGPRGIGPITGRAAGYCTASMGRAWRNPAPARRWFDFGWLGWNRRPGGRGRGNGRFAGYRRW